MANYFNFIIYLHLFILNLINIKILSNFIAHNISTMKSFKIYILFILLTIVVSSADLNTKIEWLYQRLQSRCWEKDQPFKNPKSPQHIKGLYQSHIHINFIDKKNSYFSTLMRRNSLDDNNMFVTSFVLYSLI